MDKNPSSGLLGFLGLIACAVLYFIAWKFLPELATVLLWIYGIAAVLVVTQVAVVMSAAFHKPEKTPEQEKLEARDELLKIPRSSLMELRSVSIRIRNPQVRNSAGEVCAILDGLLKELKEYPEDLPNVRHFLDHSLAALRGVLKKYAYQEQSSVLTEDVTKLTVSNLRDLEAAAQQQYENLLANNVADITADMEVLTQLRRQNGLLE